MKQFLAERCKLVRAWVFMHGGWTKVGQFLIALITLLHAFNPQFAQLFNWLWSGIPTHAKEPLVGIAAFYAWTRDPKNKALIRQLWEGYFRADGEGQTATSTDAKTISLVLCVAVLTGAFALTGCSSFERSTFQTLAASKAAIDQAQADYESGDNIPHTEQAYEAITKAKEAQTAAVRAFQAYEAAKHLATPSSDTAELTDAMNDALADLAPLAASLKQLYLLPEQVKLTEGGSR